MQLLAHSLPGGKLAAAKDREYGRAELAFTAPCPLWDGVKGEAGHTVWMSHGDHVLSPPDGFTVVGRTTNVDVAAMADVKRGLYALQFHPEVAHTEPGEIILRNFLFKIAKVTPGWSMANFVEEEIAALREKLGNDQVVCALSGGVDSTVVAVLLHKAIGERLHCIFVDNGVLRHNEGEEVVNYLREHFNLNLKYVQAQDMFLDRLDGVQDPEEKRKLSGTASSKSSSARPRPYRV